MSLKVKGTFGVPTIVLLFLKSNIVLMKMTRKPFQSGIIRRVSFTQWSSDYIRVHTNKQKRLESRINSSLLLTY